MLVLALGIDLPITMLQVQMMVIVMVTKFNVDSSSTVTGTFSSAISKLQIPTSATTEMEISAQRLPSKTRKGRRGAANGGTLVHEKQEEELHLYFVALRDIEVGTELCYDYGIDYWDEKIQ